jgi:phage-related protein (TIGR01555 family)
MELFDDFHSAQISVTQMLNESNVDVVSINGLSEILQNSKATEAMIGRFQSWKQIKSVFGVSILDQLETYEQKKLNLSGATDVLWKMLEVVAASVGIPATRFLCSSPSGLGASGHSDVVNYAESLIEKQGDIFVPRLKIIDKLLAAHYEMDYKQMEYKFKCIFPESQGEKADRLNTTATSLGILADSGIVSRESALQEAKDQGIVSKVATVGKDPNAEKMNSSANGSTNKTTTKAKSSTGGK